MTLLETPRLLFRRLTLADLDDLAALYADAEVMKYFGSTRTRKQALAQIERSGRMYEEYGFHFWATIHKAEGKFIGRCGLLPKVIEGHKECEVAYMIARRYWGMGLGTEAARAIKVYGFEKTDCPRLISIIHPQNIALIRVAEKNAMSYVKEVVIEGLATRLYAAAREQ